VYARVSLMSAVLGFIANLVIGLLVHHLPPAAIGFALDNIALNGVLGLVSASLGIETFVKYRWPGHTVAARAHAPRASDLRVAGVALALTTGNAVLCLLLLA
jgi:hypothetical protein